MIFAFAPSQDHNPEYIKLKIGKKEENRLQNTHAHTSVYNTARSPTLFLGFILHLVYFPCLSSRSRRQWCMLTLTRTQSPIWKTRFLLKQGRESLLIIFQQPSQSLSPSANIGERKEEVTFPQMYFVICEKNNIKFTLKSEN